MEVYALALLTKTSSGREKESRTAKAPPMSSTPPVRPRFAPP